MPIGGNHFTRALTKELKLTFAKAEHLKRNATKAPDPRAVFTAMRGVFNDFSSEVNRSIGFYSSVNRTAKIAKVIGLGNGFKLPGLQKFLQQNLSFEVEKLDAFDRLVGDDVVAAPQFTENLPSFAVAYGLAVQGLGKGLLKTNLLPPEIEQVRMVRRKKPWALAASALLMLSFSILFLADWGAYAKVASEEFKQATQQAKTAAKQGSDLKSAFEKVKGEFAAVKKQGDDLTSQSSDSTNWPALIQKVNQSMPDPVKIASSVLRRPIDPEDPKNFDLLAKLRVHIDAIIPRWREDVGAGWFSDADAVTDQAKSSMHVFDRGETPSGPGWIISVVGHHYNPYDLKSGLTADEKKVAQGPTKYLQATILPKFWDPALRAFGIHHACLAWMPKPDRNWTTAKSGGFSMLAPLPKYESGKGSSSGGTAPSGAPEGGGGGRGGFAGMVGGGGAGMKMAPGMGGMGGMEGMMGMMGQNGYNMGGAASAPSKEQELKTLTRTDFMISFIWQPVSPAEPPKDLAEIKKKMEEAVAKSPGAVTLDEEALAKASEKQSEKGLQEAIGAAQGQAPTKAGQAAPPASGVPTAPPK